MKESQDCPFCRVASDCLGTVSLEATGRCVLYFNEIVVMRRSKRIQKRKGGYGAGRRS